MSQDLPLSQHNDYRDETHCLHGRPVHNDCAECNLLIKGTPSDNNGGSSSYYDLPRNPVTGEWPKTLQEVIKWWDDGKGMSWNQANIFKAAYRWDKKPTLEYNCNKIGWFNDDTLRDIYEADPNNPRGAGNAIKEDTGS